MAALSEGTTREYAYTKGTNYGLAANAQVWKGGALKVDTNGHASALTTGASNRFGGFARDDAKTTGAGDVSVEVIRSGVVTLDVDGFSNASSIDKPVYAGTDNDFYNVATGNRVKVGVVIQWLSGSTVKVEFDAFAKQLAA